MKPALVATIACASGALVAAATGAPSASLPPSTGADLTALTARENAVLAELELFPKSGSQASFSRWESSLKAAETAQTNGELALDADLAGGPKIAAQPAGGHVGSSLTFVDSNGNPYSVQLVLMIDPAQGATQVTTAEAGDRFVAAVFKVTDTGEQQIAGGANDDASIVGSDGRSYGFDADSVAECSSFKSGKYQLGPGQSLSGCVVFELPANVDVSRVEWAPAADFTRGFGEWSVP